MDFKYAKMGSSLFAGGPIAGGVATGVGLAADIVMEGQRFKKEQKEFIRQGQENFDQYHLNPHAQEGGYQQGKAPLFGFALGGRVQGPARNFERRMNDPFAPKLANPDGTYSTHSMASAEVDGRFIAYPTIIQQGDSLVRLSDKQAIKYALKNNEYREFPTEKASRDYAEGGYKVGTFLGRREVPAPVGGFANGGPTKVPPYQATSDADYKFRKQMYDDSLKVSRTLDTFASSLPPGFSAEEARKAAGMYGAGSVMDELLRLEEGNDGGFIASLGRSARTMTGDRSVVKVPVLRKPVQKVLPPSSPTPVEAASIPADIAAPDLGPDAPQPGMIEPQAEVRPVRQEQPQGREAVDDRGVPRRYNDVFGGRRVNYMFNPVVGFTKDGKFTELPEKEYIFDTQDQKNAQRRKLSEREDRSSPSFAEGGHVIPAENAGEAIADADKVGVNLRRPVRAIGENHGGIVPGDGHPKADDRQMVAAGRPIRVSSGEVYVSDNVFREMARGQGKTPFEYGKEMYPDTEHSTTGYAAGGKTSGALFERTRYGRLPIDVTSILDSIPYDGEAQTGQLMDGSGGAGNDNPAGKTEEPDPDAAAKKANTVGLIANTALGVGSMIYNLARRKTTPRSPAQYTPELLEQRTVALRNSLDQERKQMTASSFYAGRGRNSLGRDLGVIARDADMRIRGGQLIEEQRNRTDQYNNELVNRAKEFNRSTMDKYHSDMAAQQNQFRQLGGQALSNSLNMISGGVGSYMNKAMQIRAAGDNRAATEALTAWSSGDPEYKGMSAEQALVHALLNR